MELTIHIFEFTRSADFALAQKLLREARLATLKKFITEEPVTVMHEDHHRIGLDASTPASKALTWDFSHRLFKVFNEDAFTLRTFKVAVRSSVVYEVAEVPD